MSLALCFFQAEDGIRDGHVTGVQTCALPILALLLMGFSLPPRLLAKRWALTPPFHPCRRHTASAAVYSLWHYPSKSLSTFLPRSEERRVGKACISTLTRLYSNVIRHA